MEDKLRLFSCSKRMFFLGRQSPFVVLASDGIRPCGFGMSSSYGLVDPREVRSVNAGTWTLVLLLELIMFSSSCYYRAYILIKKLSGAMGEVNSVHIVLVVGN